MTSASCTTIGARSDMAAPEQHPTWLELLFGGGFLAVVLPKILDLIRSSVLLRRKDDATVRVAEINEDARFRADLLARIAQLEANDAQKTAKIASLESEQNLIRRQLEGILARGDSVFAGGEPAEIAAAFRQALNEMRALLGHPPYTPAVVIGDKERKLGTGGQ